MQCSVKVRERERHTGENNEQKDIVSERDEAVLTKLVEDAVSRQMTGQHVSLDHHKTYYHDSDYLTHLSLRVN